MNWEFFWQLCDDHWILAFVILYCIVSAGAQVSHKIIRMIMVVIRGWPTQPNMDADGDIIQPISREDKSEM